MNYFSSKFTLGILGGGQLGKMLLNVTSRLKLISLTLVVNPLVKNYVTNSLKVT
jgi:5-(carboxyamino)imidazole ribonucleotide synthase